MTQNILSLDLENPNADWQELEGTLPMLSLMGCFYYHLSEENLSVLIVFGGNDSDCQLSDDVYRITLDPKQMTYSHEPVAKLRTPDKFFYSDALQSSQNQT